MSEEIDYLSLANHGNLAIVLVSGKLDRNKLTNEQVGKLLKIKEFIRSQFSEIEVPSICVEAETCICYDDDHRSDDYDWNKRDDEPQKYCSCYFANEIYEYCGCCMPLAD